MPRSLQTIIGTDKRNPLFTIFKKNGTDELHVYYGAGLLEIVTDDKNDPAFKMLLGRLYNAKINRSIMVENFGIARTTMKRWGAALKSSDPEQLVKALSGPCSPKKLTPEIKSFITVRFKDIYQQTHYNYSAIIRQEIETVFNKKISGETLRPLFKQLKQQSVFGHSAIEPAVPATADNKRSSGCDSDGEPSQRHEETSAGLHDIATAATGCQQPYHSDMEPANATNSAKQQSMRCDSNCEPSQPLEETNAELPTTSIPGEQSSSTNKSLVENNNRKHSINVPLVEKVTGFSHHLGVLIFCPLLTQLTEFITTGNHLILQWLVMVLSGAKNIEQTKLIDFDALKLLLPEVVPNLRSQRKLLTQMAANNVATELVRFNAELISAHQCRDFYYDPHTKHDTGINKLLKGWCPAIRMADKALHLDFIHTADGNPVYVAHNDNYYDLRKRFPQTIVRFRDHITMDKTAILTYIVDRAIYAIESFQDIIDDDNSHIITWEKGYQQDKWDNSQPSQKFNIYHTRNNNADLLKYHFEYIENNWHRDQRMRQIIVRAANPKGNTIEVSILSDDRTRAAEKIIRLIFCRWLQENDFKYLEKHFGINQITSYNSISYKELKGLLDDQQIVRGEYRAYQAQARNIKSKLKNLLLTAHRKKKSDAEREQQIHELTQQLVDIEQTISNTQKEESKLQALIDKEYRQLKTDNKLVMDYIKIVARNMFYICLKPFKTEYNNFRDDHVLFRNLTHSHGYISIAADEISVSLYPTVNYQPKVRKIIINFLDKINKSKPVFPDGSTRIVSLKLGEKASNLFAIPN
jgi:hypothetical protein